MKAIIPAAGIGKRLQPHTFHRPKVMVPIAGKPILEHISESLFQAGFDTISVVVGYKKEAIISYFDDKYPGKFTFPVQTDMKGLAHAVLHGLEDVDEPVLIILGDTIMDVDLTKMIHPEHNMIAVVEVEDPRRFGIVETDHKGRIIRMVEKPEQPQSNLAIAGAYFIQSQRKLKRAIEHLIEENIRTKNEFQLTDALALMMNDQEIFTVFPIQNWYDCGTVDTLLSTSRFLLSKKTDMSGKCHDCKIIEPVSIGTGSVVSNSVIGPNVAIGSHVTIQNSTLSDSMINDHAKIKDSTLDHSILGYRSRVTGYKGELNIGDDEVVEPAHKI